VILRRLTDDEDNIVDVADKVGDCLAEAKLLWVAAVTDGGVKVFMAIGEAADKAIAQAGGQSAPANAPALGTPAKKT
jgi:hypothetical protein